VCGWGHPFPGRMDALAHRKLAGIQPRDGLRSIVFLVSCKNIFAHFPDHVVPVDFSKVACRSITEPRVEIPAANESFQLATCNGDCDLWVVFLKKVKG